MTEYVEIENPKEIRRLHNRLAAKLKEALPHVEWRGHTEVRFLSATGEGCSFHTNGCPKTNVPQEAFSATAIQATTLRSL